ncbi:hypothetical protein C7974DRAFT_216351 [Boeremia exigua]|uniref:uncharacterized protein n=1 Tax=Boeremia exigua TaxID=749465 RepID=UPI001E8DAC88|nr:uncharacterized protein C7974DRAFT_216351 [Boeremia exigua]KAH6622112.1 hypothetical protein C7974DRAFT_216351 [Boeremia exigua]
MAPKRKNARIIQTRTPTRSSSTVFFYHPDEKPYGVFCQWKSSPITIPTTTLHSISARPSDTDLLVEHGNSISFSCAEQSYMFCKALYFGDAESCRKILMTVDPAEQKKFGKSVKGFSDEEWDKVKSRVVRVGNWYKFTHPDNRHMRDVLLETTDNELAEAGRRDRVWGIGYQAHEAERYRKNWGLNKLGKTLMAVRTRIGEVMLKERETGVMDSWVWDGGENDEVDEAELRVWTGIQEQVGDETAD